MSGEGTVEQVIASQARWCVLHGDCLEMLRALPDASVDACVTDPPYDLRSGGARGFMGKRWDGTGIAFRPETWAELLRVLKPGAHVVACGGTRTFHRMICAIEDGGFEIRDSLALLGWIYGSGFPKSLSVSKAIDAHLGAEPTVIGTRTLSGTAALTTEEKGGTYSAGISAIGAKREVPVTAPTTEEAKRWDGFGTAMKPSFEPLTLARRPLDGTVAENVLAHGTGALAIDACRVATDWNEPDRPDSWKASGHSAQPDAEKIAAPPGEGIECHPDGRWPPNVVALHTPLCRRVGSKKVPTGTCYEPDHGTAMQRSIYGATQNLGRVTGYADSDGLETIDAWQCTENCPVRLLDQQSGELTSGAWNGVVNAARGNLAKGIEAERPRIDRDAETGTASRFFPQFQHTAIDDLTPWYYAAKASRSEREDGCERLPARSGAEAVGRADGSAGAQSPRAGAGRTATTVRNTHPTVKPIDLMRWLVRLITPPDGIVIDLFAGSGSAGCAALLEHKRFIGIELNDSDEEPYVTIARARIRHIARQGVQLGLFG